VVLLPGADPILIDIGIVAEEQQLCRWYATGTAPRAAGLIRVGSRRARAPNWRFDAVTPNLRWASVNETAGLRRSMVIRRRTSRSPVCSSRKATGLRIPASRSLADSRSRFC
jgi:hypothetical protein